MTRRNRILLAVGVVGAALGLVLWRVRDRVIDVELAVVERATFESGIAETGRSRARWHVDLTAPVSGEWDPAPLKVGDSVVAGALLGALSAAPADPTTARQASARVGAATASLAAARAAVLAAQRAFEDADRSRQRAERLVSAGGVAEEQLDHVRTEAELRRRELDAARARLAAAEFERDAARALLPGGAGAPVRVRAPAAGVVLRIDEEHPRTVGAGAPLLMIGSLGDPEIVVPVLSADAASVRIGATLRATCGRDTLTGRVTRVEPTAYTVRSALGVDEQRVRVIGDVPDCPLGHDFEVEVLLVTDRREGALVVPAGALVRDGGGYHVFVVDDEGRARRTPVTVAGRNRDEASIEGLDEGTRVVVYPPEGLADGSRVRFRAAPGGG